MQEKSSVNQSLTGTGKFVLLMLNFLPLLHLSLCISVIWWPFPLSIGSRLTIALATLYLLPALMGRLFKQGCKSTTHIEIGDKAFFYWWASAQCQLLFNRLPMLEEILRLVPGLYSMWLRLWGSRIGRLTFWSPGTVVLDRGFLVVGKDVVLGAGVRLNPHVISKDAQGDLILQLASIDIGHLATIGGYSLLTAGTIIEDDEATRACLVSPPFSHWKNNKRVKKM